MPHLKHQVSLKAHNTFGIDVQAQYWIEITTETQAREFLMDNLSNPLNIFILGGGSNILFTEDVQAVVLKNNILGKEVVWENDEHLHLKLGAGENWHDCVAYCVERNWGGIENLSLIPGTAGAAPIQNIGAYGVELKDVFVELEAMSLRTGISRTFGREACEFGYRDSIFKRNKKGEYLITSITLQLSKYPVINTSYGAIESELERLGGERTIHRVSEAVCNIRRSKLPDPEKIGNAGSFFKNPVIDLLTFKKIQEDYPDIPHYPQGEEVKLAAAWLIQQCGWKGKTFGTYGVHKNQALVLVNYGGSAGKDIYHLSEKIIASVYRQFEISLTREVNVL